jgi:uncharacterized membrane protein
VAIWSTLIFFLAFIMVGTNLAKPGEENKTALIVAEGARGSFRED